MKRFRPSEEQPDAAWFRALTPERVAEAPWQEIVTVVVDTQANTIKAFVYWVFLEDVRVKRRLRGPAWSAVRWSLGDLGNAKDRQHRSYASGRAVELIYHSFNEANLVRTNATGVHWELNADFGPSLAETLRRAEFVAIARWAWWRPVLPRPMIGEVVASRGPRRTGPRRTRGRA